MTKISLYVKNLFVNRFPEETGRPSWSVVLARCELAGVETVVDVAGTGHTAENGLIRSRPGGMMITGAHAILYSTAADELRAFLRDKLGFSGVDIGGGWLIFGLPPAELAVHPTGEQPSGDLLGQCELYLMCDDINATLEELTSKGVEVSRPVSDQRWGLLTALRLPGGTEIGLYEPRHPTALP